MTSRISQIFKDNKNNHKKTFISYLVCGDPSKDYTLSAMHTMASSGVDIIELGIPFSDPMADGPVIQRSSERALKKGVNLQKCLNWVKEFRLQNKFTPIVLMGYANPIERFGIEDFAKEASNADVDGVLIVDYPPEEALNFCRLMKTHPIDNSRIGLETADIQAFSLGNAVIEPSKAKTKIISPPLTAPNNAPKNLSS